MQPAKSPYTRDFKPPAKPQPAATDESVKTEVVSDIPVKTENQASQSNNPIANSPAHPAAAPAVDVHAPDQKPADANPETSKQSDGKKDTKLSPSKKPGAKKPSNHSARPVGPIIIAIIVAVALFVAAYSAFKSSGG